MYMRTASLDPCKATLPSPPSSSLTLPGATTRHRRDHSRALLRHHSAGPTVTIEVRSPAEPPVGELLLVDLSVPIAIKQAHRGFRLDSRQRAAEGLAKLLELICGLVVATAGQPKRWSERRPPATRLVQNSRRRTLVDVAAAIAVILVKCGLHGHNHGPGVRACHSDNRLIRCGVDLGHKGATA